MKVRGSATGPIVLLGSANSVFTCDLARILSDRGYPVHVVSLQSPGEEFPQTATWIDGRSRSLAARAGFKVIRPLAHFVQRQWMERSLEHFRRATGKDRPDDWEWAVWDQMEHAWRLSRLALQQQPRCVIGQELAGYGLPTALCRGVPRILQPWGSDIFFTAESWPGAHQLIRYAVTHCELLIPSSVTAADYLCQRFRVPPERVLGISFGIDPSLVTATDPETRTRICQKWNLNPNQLIVQNCRRFRRLWGSEAALQAFLQVARDSLEVQFLLIGGGAEIPEIAEAAQRIKAAGLSSRFTLIDRRVTATEYIELARVSDIAVSLMGRGDMRSASVLVQAASGSAQVIADQPEFRQMMNQGFRATLVNASNVEEVVSAIKAYIDNPERRQAERDHNRRFLLEEENQTRQMDRILGRINALCEEFHAK